MKNFLILSILIFLILGCKSKNHKLHENNNKLHFEKKSIIKLSHSLDEISGLAITKDGKLFCHDDERGIVYQIDYNDGHIIKRFQLGKFGIDADFEAIAIAGTKFFLMASNGILYEFNEGKDLEKIKFKKHYLGFNSKFEFESLCYDETTNSLLFVCKKYSGKKNKKNRAVFSFSLKNNTPSKTPKFLISLSELKEKFNVKDFYPSAITIHSKTHDYFVLSSKGQPVLVRISNKGKLLNAYKLDKHIFVQPEGMVFISDTTLLISNEAKTKRATLIKLNISEL